MKVKLLSSILVVVMMLTSAYAQNILLQDDFETGMPTEYDDIDISMTDYFTITDDAGMPGRGFLSTARDFNTPNVDFLMDENNGGFYGVNPELNPRGFYYPNNSITAIDLSEATETLKLRFKYLITNTLNWAVPTHPTGFSLTLNNTTTSFNVPKTTFDTRGAWTFVTVELPAALKTTDVSMNISIVAGDGVAIDDLEFFDEAADGTYIKALYLENFPKPITVDDDILSTFSRGVTVFTSVCKNFSIGTADQFTTASIDFNNTENATSFLGFNPEVCKTGPKNINIRRTISIETTTEPLVFTCRYFRSSADNSDFNIFFEGGNTHITQEQFSQRDEWTELTVDLPADFTGNSFIGSDSFIEMFIRANNANGIAIDDIIIKEKEITGISSKNNVTATIYPNPFKNEVKLEKVTNTKISVYALDGNLVGEYKTSVEGNLNLSDLEKGVYLLHYLIYSLLHK